MSTRRTEIKVLTNGSELYPLPHEKWRILSGTLSHITGTASWLSINHKGMMKNTVAYADGAISSDDLPLGVYEDETIGAVHYLVAMPYVPTMEVDGAEEEFLYFIGDATANVVVVVEVLSIMGAPEEVPEIEKRIWWQ